MNHSLVAGVSLMSSCHFPCSKAKQSQWSRRRRTNGAAMFSENSFSIPRNAIALPFPRGTCRVFHLHELEGFCDADSDGGLASGVAFDIRRVRKQLADAVHVATDPAD